MSCMDQVKIINGATYTLIARRKPAPGQNVLRWVGDDGAEVELTDAESRELADI